MQQTISVHRTLSRHTSTLNYSTWLNIERPGALEFVSRDRQAFCPSPKRSDQPTPPTSLLTIRTEGFILWQIGPRLKVTTCLHLRYDMICLLTAIGLSPGGSSTVHIYTQTVHRTTQNKQYIELYINYQLDALTIIYS